MTTVQGSPDGLDVVHCPDAASWSDWLSRNHDSARGVWLKLAKKGSPEPTVTYAEALDAALCQGWIDGQVRRFDEHFYLQRFTPRRARSRWSQNNRDRALELIANGEMQPAGLAEVEAAQADGRFQEAYEAQARATVPEDLRRALDAEPQAAEFFATLTGARRYALLYRLHHVRSPERRSRRIAEYVALLKQGRTLS